MPNKLSPSELYRAAVEQMPPEHIDHHSYGSDLYLKVTPISDKLVENYEFSGDVTIFRDQIEHALWYEIPFGYLPYWENLPR